MALNWRTLAALPRLYTYADADGRERETKPVRGDEQQRKPLGRRNQKWRHIKREADNSVSIYITGWMHNPLPTIRFYPNGEIHVLGCPYWFKAAENEVIEAVLMLHHHPEWFVEREVLVGEKKHDRYAWAFPKEEQTT